MSITYERHELYPESIFIRRFIGNISLNDIIDSWEYLRINKVIDDQIKGVINNLSECNLILDMESFKTLIAYLEKQNYLKDIKLAVIADTPKKIIFPVLGENNESGLKIRPFTTIKAAVDWILSD